MNALTSQNNGRVIFEKIVTSALQPECPGIQPQLASWKPPRAEEWEALIYIVPREKCRPSRHLTRSFGRLTFHHFADDFAGARSVIRQDIKLRAGSCWSTRS